MPHEKIILEVKQNNLDLENRYYQHKKNNTKMTALASDQKVNSFLISLLLGRTRHEPHDRVSFKMGQWDIYSCEDFG